jgi:hypothetical protein
MQHDDTLHEDAKLFSSDGGRRAMDGSKVLLCVDGTIRVLECQHEWSIELEGNSQHDLSRRWLDLNFLHCMLTAFPVGQRWCTISDHPLQLITNMYSPLPGSNARAPAIGKYVLLLTICGTH